MNTWKQKVLDVFAEINPILSLIASHPGASDHAKQQVASLIDQAETLAVRWMAEECLDAQLILVASHVRNGFKSITNAGGGVAHVDFGEVRKRIIASQKIHIPVGCVPLYFREFVERLRNVITDVESGLGLLAGDNIESGIERIVRLEREGLIVFAVREDANPMLFVAAEHHFERGPDFIATKRLLSWFDTQGGLDTATGKMYDDSLSVSDWLERSTNVIKKISEDLHTRSENVASTLLRLGERGHITCHSTEDRGAWVNIRCEHEEDWTTSEMKIVQSLAKHFGVHEYGRKTITTREPAGDPQSERAAWNRAVETQQSTLTLIEKVVGTPNKRITLPSGESVDPRDIYESDIRALRAAEVFCWMEDPILAVGAASASLPKETRLTRNMTPTNAGWWYFNRPIDCRTTSQQDRVCALLWEWFREIEKSDNPLLPDRVTTGLAMMAYVIEGEHMLPSTRWFWRESLTIDENLELCRTSYRETYMKTEGLLGETATIAAMEQLTRFFAAGCLWMQQRIVVETRQSAERHFRRRVERETGRKVPDVRVVHLRRRAQAAQERTDSDPKKVDWKCRWIVDGHWRQQPYKTTGEIRPIWIDSYDKGPDGLPLRVKAKRVFQVSR